MHLHLHLQLQALVSRLALWGCGCGCDVEEASQAQAAIRLHPRDYSVCRMGRNEFLTHFAMELHEWTDGILKLSTVCLGGLLG